MPAVVYGKRRSAIGGGLNVFVTLQSMKKIMAKLSIVERSRSMEQASVPHPTDHVVPV